MILNRCPQTPSQRDNLPRNPPRQQPVSTRPYFNQPTSSNDYIYQQSLRQNQKPIPWRLVPMDAPVKTTRNKEIPPNPNDPQLTLEDLEEMNKQLLAELEVSSSDSSLDSTPTQDLEALQDLEDLPRRLDHIR